MSERSRHVMVLGDQLNRSVGPLADADPADTSVLMVESRALAEVLPHHKQKLALVFSAMRHFARALEEDGFAVDYRREDSFEAGVEAYVVEHGGIALEMARPTDWGVEARLREAAEGADGELRVTANGLWLTADDEFDEWAEGRKTLRLEYFYRSARKRRGWLVDDSGEPEGGQWNFDADNRETPEAGHDFPDPPAFEPDALTREVIEEVERDFPDHFGSIESFGWPVTRSQALEALDGFLGHRLARFGPFEDAMVAGEDVLYHSLLSPALNLGLLTAEEVCEAALAHAADSNHDVPIQSIEGFIRQVLGWREFIRHVYRRFMPDLREANGFEHDGALPDLYWGGGTDMRCLAESVDQLVRTGHTHHIQRLMVLGNFALIAGVSPQALNEWFLGSYVDALDWVVTPNVIGMSQFADMGSFTSKPYAASGKYVNRMSDYCAGCRFDPNETLGEAACPLNSLYWDFIDRHFETLDANGRMRLITRNWRGRDEDDRDAILERAAQVKAVLSRGEL